MPVAVHISSLPQLWTSKLEQWPPKFKQKSQTDQHHVKNSRQQGAPLSYGQLVCATQAAKWSLCNMEMTCSNYEGLLVINNNNNQKHFQLMTS